MSGLDANREMVLVELPARRVDRIVADLEALRVHLDRDHLDVVAHSAGGSLALLYAAAHPERVGRIALVTPTLRAVGIEPTEQEWLGALARRSDQPWYAEARKALDGWAAGEGTPANRLAAAPFFYGRWDDKARAHAAAEPVQTKVGGAAVYYTEGAFHPAATKDALADVSAPVLVIVGELDLQPSLRAATELAVLFPHAEVVVQPGAGHYPWLDDPVAFVRTPTDFLGA